MYVLYVCMYVCMYVHVYGCMYGLYSGLFLRGKNFANGVPFLKILPSKFAFLLKICEDITIFPLEKNCYKVMYVHAREHKIKVN